MKATRIPPIALTLALLAWSPAVTAASHLLPHEPVDALGRPVLTAAGAPINYPTGLHGEASRFPWGPPEPPAATAACPTARTAGAGDELSFHLEWYRPALDRPIGLGGLAVADLDGDGANEIVLTSNFDTWLILSRQGSTYEQVWSSLPMPSPLVTLQVVTLFGEKVVLLGHADGTLELIDPVTRQPFRTITTTATDFRGLTLANIDVDATPEAIFCDANEIFRVDLYTGAGSDTPQWMPCRDLAVGQVDNDPELEIVVATPSDPAFVINAATGVVEWTNNLGFGEQVEAGDIDGDGRDEIVAGVQWSEGFTVYDGETQSGIYSHPLNDLAVIRLINMDADPPLEIVYGDGQWGSIHVIDGATGLQDWAMPNPNHGVTNIAVGNVDNDLALEVLWGAGFTSSGEDFLYVGDAATHLSDWHSTDLSGGFYALGGADVDNDDMPEIYFSSYDSNSHYTGGVWAIFDGATKTLERQFTPPDYPDIWRLVTADVTGSLAHELFVAGNHFGGYSGRLICLDLDNAPLWNAFLPSGITFRSLALADVDDDGELEAVASVGVEHSGATTTSVYVYDAETGALEWQSPLSMGVANIEKYSLLRLANVDGDSNLEAAVGAIGGRVWVWDLTTHQYQAVTLDTLGVVALEAADLDGDTTSEILIGTSDGAIRRIDPNSGSPSTVHDSFGTPVNSLVAHDFTGDGTKDFLYACNGDLVIREGATGNQLWSSGYLGVAAGLNDTVKVGDFDGDGETEILAGLERGVVMFGDDMRDVGLMRDGFESGTLFRWVAE